MQNNFHIYVTLHDTIFKPVWWINWMYHGCPIKRKLALFGTISSKYFMFSGFFLSKWLTNNSKYKILFKIHFRKLFTPSHKNILAKHNHKNILTKHMLRFY